MGLGLQRSEGDTEGDTDSVVMNRPSMASIRREMALRSKVYTKSVQARSAIPYKLEGNSHKAFYHTRHPGSTPTISNKCPARMVLMVDHGSYLNGARSLASFSKAQRCTQQNPRLLYINKSSRCRPLHKLLNCPPSLKLQPLRIVRDATSSGD